MHRLDHWRPFLMLAVALIVAGVFRSAWATRLDGFTIDEPWHVTAGVAYLRTVLIWHKESLLFLRVW